MISFFNQEAVKNRFLLLDDQMEKEMTCKRKEEHRQASPLILSARNELQSNGTLRDAVKLLQAFEISLD